MAKAEPEKRKIQMADIARLAGVSTATVSRALNGSALINEETRLRIIELARSLNYTINLGAQNLRKGDSSTIGVVIPFNAANKQNITDPFFLAILGSLADALTDKQYDLLLSRVDADHLDRISALYDSGRVGGIVVVGQWGHHDQLNELARQRLPFVAWGAQLPNQLYCSVGGDNASGGQLATEHLIALGHRRIAFYGGHADSSSCRQRRAGHAQAMKRAGLPVDPAWLIESAPNRLEAAARTGELFGDQAPPTAAVCYNDTVALGLMLGLLARGIQPGKGFAVTGFDDIPEAAVTTPPLTTLAANPRERGRQAAQLVLAQMDEGAVPRRTIAPVTLSVRESSGVTLK